MNFELRPAEPISIQQTGNVNNHHDALTPPTLPPPPTPEHVLAYHNHAFIETPNIAHENHMWTTPANGFVDYDATQATADRDISMTTATNNNGTLRAVYQPSDDSSLYASLSRSPVTSSGDKTVEVNTGKPKSILKHRVTFDLAPNVTEIRNEIHENENEAESDENN